MLYARHVQPTVVHSIVQQNIIVQTTKIPSAIQLILWLEKLFQAAYQSNDIKKR